MLQIQGFNKLQMSRMMSECIEPLLVHILKKKYHTFFVYRCSDYQNLKHLCECHKFDYKSITKKNLLEEYWSSIDLIYFHVFDLPEYEVSKEYFDALNRLERREKKVMNYVLFEVKISSTLYKPILSVRTKICMELFGKLHKIIVIKYENRARISLDFTHTIKDCDVRTHCGRRNVTIYG